MWAKTIQNTQYELSGFFSHLEDLTFPPWGMDRGTNLTHLVMWREVLTEPISKLGNNVKHEKTNVQILHRAKGRLEKWEGKNTEICK